MNIYKRIYGDAPSFPNESLLELKKMASRHANIIHSLVSICSSEQDFTARKCSLQSVFHKFIEHLQKNIWGRSGFDRMFGESKLRVSALFRVINEQNKLNATNNVVDASAAFGRHAEAVAA